MPVQNINQPVLMWQFAPTTDSNSGNYPTTWYDLTNSNGIQVMQWNTKEGKQRELGVAEAGIATVVCRDPNEYLNTQNTSSPLNSGGNLLKLYRGIRCAYMPGSSYTAGTGFSWAGNLLNNTNNVWLGVRNFGGTYQENVTFEGGTVGTWQLNGGVTSANSTAQAHDGTHSLLLTWPTQSSGGGFGTSIRMPIPPIRTGYTYTLSAWVYIISGPAVSIYFNGAFATSTTTTGAWQRVTLTRTVTDGDQGDVYIWAQGNTTAGQQCYVDSVQLEYAGSASTFTTTGPGVYPVWSGYVERYPSSWKYAGFEGWCHLECTDALGMFPRTEMLAALHQEMNIDAPSYWWPFNDQNTQAGNFNIAQIGTVQNPNIKVWLGASGSVGSATSTVSSDGVRAGPLPDQFSSLNIQAAYNPPNAAPNLPDAGACLFTTSSWTGTTVGGSAAGFTVEFWMLSSVLGNWEQHVFELGTSTSTDNHDQYQINITATTNHVQFQYWDGTGTNLENIVSSAAISTGVWNHVVFTTSSNGTNITSQLYLNGSLAGTSTRAGSTITVYNRMILGTGFDNTGSPATGTAAGFLPFWGKISEFALYQNKVLASGRVSSHYTMGNNGYDLDQVGTRLLRILGYAGWNGGTNITAASGVQLGTIRGMENQDVLSYMKVATDSDAGLLYCDQSGRVSYIAQSTIAALSSIATFGENDAGGEIPYQETPQQETEPSQVFNRVTVNPYGLPNQDKFLIPLTVNDSASQQAYGIRPIQVDGIFETGTTAGATNLQNLAAFVLAQKKDPRPMITNVSVNMGANPSLWTKVLPLAILNRVTWKRRSKQANAGAGLTISLDGYVQTIQWSGTKGGDVKVVFDIEPVQV